MVRVTPLRLQGGMTAATRDVLHGHQKGPLVKHDAVGFLQEAPALDKDTLRPVDHDFAHLRVQEVGLDGPQKRQDHFEATPGPLRRYGCLGRKSPPSSPSFNCWK